MWKMQKGHIQLFMMTSSISNFEQSCQNVIFCNHVSVKRSHYVTMVDNNRRRFFLAVEPAYADVE
jgi:hypothetical protein